MSSISFFPQFNQIQQKDFSALDKQLVKMINAGNKERVKSTIDLHIQKITKRVPQLSKEVEVSKSELDKKRVELENSLKKQTTLLVDALGKDSVDVQEIKTIAHKMFEEGVQSSFCNSLINIDPEKILPEKATSKKRKREEITPESTPSVDFSELIAKGRKGEDGTFIPTDPTFLEGTKSIGQGIVCYAGTVLKMVGRVAEGFSVYMLAQRGNEYMVRNLATVRWQEESILSALVGVGGYCVIYLGSLLEKWGSSAQGNKADKL